MLLTPLVAALTPLALLASDSDSSPTWLLLAGPLGAAVVYFGLWTYYRNTDKSHRFEHETRIAAQPIAADDAKLSEVTGTTRQRISGENATSHRQRVERF